MKRTTLLLIATVLSTGLWAQSKTLKSFHEKYHDDRDATNITIDGTLLNLVGALAAYAEDDEEAQAFANIAKNIKSMNILSVPMYGTGLSGKEVSGLRRNLKKESYEELMTMRDGDQKINFLADADEKQLRNMVVLVEDKDELVVMNINGLLNMKDLSKLVSNRKHWSNTDH